MIERRMSFRVAATLVPSRFCRFETDAQRCGQISQGDHVNFRGFPAPGDLKIVEFDLAIIRFLRLLDCGN
jgi:hypothetical protein